MMEEIKINQEYKDLVIKYGPGQTVNGFSNLSSSDLKKSSRLGFQYTGIYGEIGWRIFRYSSIEELKNMITQKVKYYHETGKGDGGFDDQITHNGKTRLIDVKTTHITDETQIPRLNLVIPEREYHQNMIYVCAFTVGSNKEDRLNIDKIILAGWTATENITKRWRIDPSKYAVSVNDLRPLSALKKIFTSGQDK